MNDSTNQTPAASASRNTPEHWMSDGATVFISNARGLGESIGGFGGLYTGDVDRKRAALACACVNALAGMEPGAVAVLVAAAERMVAALAHEREMREIAGDGGRDEAELRAALAALKGGAK